NSLGVSLQTIGRFDEALKRFNESLDIAHQVGATRRAAFAQAGIGDVYLGRGDYPRALNAYAASSQLAADAGVRSLGVYNLVKQGECYYRQHNLARTLELAGKAREIAAETNLLFEQGLAYTLQGKAYVKQGEYGAAGDLFAHALTCLAGNDVLEQTKVKLWLGYSYLLNLRASLAFEQLQDALKLTLAMGELMPALAQTVLETQPLLVHFLHRAGASRSTRGSIRLLLAQSRLKITSPRPGLQFFAFGTPVLIAGGERKPLLQRGKIGKTPELLAYLLLNGKNDGCRWNEVSLALWPDLERERASINFHQLLKRLRHNLSGEADYIIVQDDFYRIDPRYIEWCDAVAFDALFEQAAQTSPDEALALRLELIALYQGEFLADYELGDWGITRRASYEARILQTITLAGEHLMANGAFQQALGVINRGLSLNYFQEDLHRSAFKAYAHLGLYDHLAHYYSELRQKYRQELDAPPDRMTEALYRRLVTSR
ncbi:MAG: BTAD domain-containing putative transcriptional regulator, partial [Anaerolineae bacterium]